MIPLKDNVAIGGVPLATIALVAVLFLAFLWQLTLSGAEGSAGDRNGDVVVGDLSERDEFAITYGMTPARVAGDEGDAEFEDQPPGWLSPLTAVPVAADFLHLVVGAWILLIFGRAVEARLGRARYGAVIVAALAGGAVIQTLADPDATELVIGAWAAVAGVVGAHLMLFRRAAIVTVSVIPLFGTVLEVPAPLMAAGWLLIGLIPAVGPLVEPDLLAGVGLEYLGLAGALAAGGALGLLLARGRPFPDPTPASA